MKNTRIHSISRFMCLGIVLLVLSDCGGSDNPIVVENTPAGDPVTVIPDDPIPVLPNGPPERTGRKN
ncbi:MAG: hypothetical protein O7E52_25270 [Candidatus Poribacteria bacterium]|nr:hypothetical protein [Candidatus Poribacteria bacterium]